MGRLAISLCGLAASGFRSTTSPGAAKDAVADDALGDAPVDVLDAPPDAPWSEDGIVIEVESFGVSVPANALDTWALRTDQPGYSGTGYMEAVVDDATSCLTHATVPTCAPRRSYQLPSIAGGFYVHFRQTSFTGDQDSCLVRPVPINQVEPAVWRWETSRRCDVTGNPRLDLDARGRRAPRRGRDLEQRDDALTRQNV